MKSEQVCKKCKWYRYYTVDNSVSVKMYDFKIGENGLMFRNVELINGKLISSPWGLVYHCKKECPFDLEHELAIQ